MTLFRLLMRLINLMKILSSLWIILKNLKIRISNSSKSFMLKSTKIQNYTTKYIKASNNQTATNKNSLSRLIKYS